MKNRKALALIAILALVAAACGGSDDAAEEVVEEVTEAVEEVIEEVEEVIEEVSSDPLVLASLMPLSGDLASLGPGIALGAALAVEQINAAGGINGQPVVLIEGDSGCDGAVALTSLNEVIASNFMKLKCLKRIRKKRIRKEKLTHKFSSKSLIIW